MKQFNICAVMLFLYEKKKVWCILWKEASSILDVQVLGCVVNCIWIGSFKCLDLHIELIVKHILFYLHTIINVCKECTIFIDKNHLYANTFSWITIKSLNHCYYFPISIVNSILVILLVYTFIHVYIASSILLPIVFSWFSKKQKFVIF